MKSHRFKIIIILFITFSSFLSIFKCSEPINVHLICHSHDDSGWLRTIDEYYEHSVDTIINGVINALLDKNSLNTRKFSWSEIGFLEMWWNRVDDNRRDSLRKLVNEGKFEFINGGWVMNDEACPTPDAVIRQLSIGHKFIRDNFGSQYLPESGWQIDPFGHSNLTPYVQAQMGHKQIILNRLHYDKKEEFKKDKSLIFKWKSNYGPVGDILAYVLDDFYTWPTDLNFDGGYVNANQTAHQMVRTAVYKSGFYKAPHIVFPMGGDFAYAINAQNSFEAMSQVIDVVNFWTSQGKANVNVKFSTLKEFFQETIQWHINNNVEFPSKQGDFFPDAEPYTYWTGYFTSRPILKVRDRNIEDLLRATEIFHSMQNHDHQSTINNAAKNSSFIQHHDAITGTAREEVYQDYLDRLDYAEDELDSVMKKVLESLMNLKPNYILNPIKASSQLVVPPFDFAVPITLVNSLNVKRYEVYNISVRYYDPFFMDPNRCPFDILDKNGLPIQFDCSFRNYGNDQWYKLDFYVEIDPLNIELFVLVPGEHKIIEPTDIVPQELTNNALRVNLKPNGLVDSVVANNQFITLSQEILEYQDYGGAYIFRSGSVKNFTDSLYVYKSFIGQLSQELLLTDATESIQVSIRIFNCPSDELNNKIQFRYQLASHEATQTIVRFNTDIGPLTEFYSDNGLEMISRQPQTVNDIPETKYFPSIQSLMIRNSNGKSLYCNNDRSKGASASINGSMEFAIQRNLLYDDQKGLDIPPRDHSVVNVVSECYANKEYSRHDANQLEHPILGYYITFLSYQILYEADKNYFTIDHSLKTSLEFLSTDYHLPQYIHIMSLEYDFKALCYRMRIMNTNQFHPDEEYHVDISRLFNNKLRISKQLDISLLNDYKLNDISNIKSSNIPFGPTFNIPRFSNNKFTSNSITIKPMEILSFELLKN
ncbi:alpha-mannosidase [Tieghemostelium lacteum]|uniref:alpha-mannosidase n=1 Tax=Tieghemostelium lacteum TaxID=361077 RepID=A0A151Z5Y9_TIELA|nr:alpha-mannosidase [Tieghemostelium lacteum]|eukprot:KYQ89369.1 alpha-mannosidase [Tieghemostelium lacteum]